MKKIILLIVIILAGLGTYQYIQTKKSNEKEIKQVVVENLKKENLHSSIEAEGTVEVTNEVDIYVSKSQRIDKVYFEEGDEVKKGEMLISFDPEERNDIKREIEKKKIEIENEKINLQEYRFEISKISLENKKREIESINVENEKLEKELTISENEKLLIEKEYKNKVYDYNVKKELFDIEGISISELNEAEEKANQLEKELERKKWEIEKAKIDISENLKQKKLLIRQEHDMEKDYRENEKKRLNNISRAKNNIKRLEIEIQGLEENLEKTYKKVLSPVSGTLIEVNAEDNFRVNLEESLMKIADIESQVIKANISSYDIKHVKKGQKVLISSDALSADKKIQGKVKKISSIAKVESGSGYEDVVVEVEIEYDAENSGLVPGYKVELNIITKEKENVLTVPSFSIVKEKNISYIFAVESDMRVKKYEIKTGMNNDTKTEVKNLEEGMRIVSNPMELKENDIVKIVDKIQGKPSKKSNNGGGRP